MKKKILVIGDSFIDVYLHLQFRKQNPEAEGSVYNIVKEEYFLGGAAAVAMMCKSLGAEVSLATIAGTDHHGTTMANMLLERKIDGVDQNSKYLTALKNRMIIEDNLYPDRFDFEHNKNISDEIAYRFLVKAKKADIILISDYGKGICTKYLLDNLPNKLILVDPAINSSWGRYHRASIIKANEKEAIAALQETKTISHITDYARTLADIYDRTVVVTRGEIGIQYAYHNQTATSQEHQSGFIPSLPTVAKDICGAGDTVFAILGVYLSRGFALNECCRIAIQYAAQQIKSFGIQPLKEIQYATQIR